MEKYRGTTPKPSFAFSNRLPNTTPPCTISGSGSSPPPPYDEAQLLMNTNSLYTSTQFQFVEGSNHNSNVSGILHEGNLHIPDIPTLNTLKTFFKNMIKAKEREVEPNFDAKYQNDFSFDLELVECISSKSKVTAEKERVVDPTNFDKVKNLPSSTNTFSTKEKTYQKVGDNSELCDFFVGFFSSPSESIVKKNHTENKENMELWNMKMHHQLMEDADALGDEWDDSSEDETMETENSEENVGEEEEVLLDDIGSGEESGSGSDSEDSFSFLEEEEVLTDRSDDSLVEFDYGEELADPPASAKGFDEVDNVQLEGRVNNVLRDYVFIDSDNDTSHQHENGMAPVNRRVTFNLTPTVHTMVVWDYAYRAARKGKWEEAARDNARFSRRIDSLRPELEAILRMDHRQRIYEERFGAPADDSTIEKSI